jgi:serine phosphatase RsbU (regulator of sigma subunit)/anti-sigma regulatory factor (Ser/Thr protein kinase)
VTGYADPGELGPSRLGRPTLPGVDPEVRLSFAPEHGSAAESRSPQRKGQMDDLGTGPAAGPSDAWPAAPDTTLVLNRMGSFDWDLDSGRLHLDRSALAVFDLLPGEYDCRPATLARRMPAGEQDRLNSSLSQALKDGSAGCGAYFRIARRDGTLHWAHAQGRIGRAADGRPRRVIGLLRDATDELVQAAQRMNPEQERRRTASLVEETTFSLAHAMTVRDVTAVLSDGRGLGRLGAASLALGLVEGGRIRVLAEGQAGSFIPELEVTRIDDAFPMGEVVRTLAPRYITSPEEFARRYPRLWRHIEPLGVSAAAYLPLIAQARPIGALGLLYRGKYSFSPEERNLLVALSSAIAQSLQRAMLFDQEHDLAEGLQTAMLPRSIAQVPGVEIAVRYRSARLGRDIGGDWYDAVPLPGGRVGVTVGDVQGHDTHAAAVMGQLRIALRAYASEGHSPAAVMARASVFLWELDTDRFATCVYAEVDPAAGTALVVRAGHLAPMLRHTDGWCRPVPGPVGLPLGLSAQFADLEYPVSTLDLAQGETLLLCSDGLVERPGADLDDGITLLGEAVRQGPKDLQALADRLCETMGERTGGEDDMALLLLTRLPGSVPETGRHLHQYIAPADPQGLAAARQLVRDAVRAWGVSERLDDIELVADELVTNALRHTGGGALLSVRLPAGEPARLRVEVQDRSSSLPWRRDLDTSATSGRGMLVVHRLTDLWGVEPRGSGKCVWGEFACGPAEPDPDSAHWRGAALTRVPPVPGGSQEPGSTAKSA